MDLCPPSPGLVSYGLTFCMGQVQTGSGDIELAMMPTKFKKLIWIKRGDFAILSASADLPAAENTDTTSAAATSMGTPAEAFKVNYIFKHILTKPQIRHIQQVGLW